MNTALNRTTIAFLTNKSGGALTYGDVVVLDNTNDNGFTTTTSAALSTRGLGVILDVAGIANNATGAVAIGGWCPQINLNTAATVGQFINTHTVAGQGTPHDSPQVAGDFAVALTASATPPAMLFGSPNGSTGGGGTPGGSDTQIQYNNAGSFGGITGATTDGTTLTLVAPVLGTPASLTLTNATGLVTAGINASQVTLAKIQNASANSRWVGSGSAGSGAAYTENTFGSGLTVGASSVDLSTAAKTRAIGISIDGGGSVITSGIKGVAYIPYACTITAVTMVADQSGSATMDIQTAAYNVTPSYSSIVAAAPPTLSSHVASQDTTLTGWTTSISAGTFVQWTVNASPTSITQLNVTLTVTV